MTTADAKKKIASFIKDTGNKGLGAEYRATDEKWLFVSYSILDELELPTTEALVNYAEDILAMGELMSEFERTWFALLADGTLAILGDHGDYEAADATATDLGYDAIWLVCGNDAAQWADAINSQRYDAT